MIFMFVSINLCIFTKVVQNPFPTPQTWKVDHFLKTQNNSLFSKPAISGHVKVSFEEPEYTAQADGVGTLRLLEAILGT